MTVCPDSLIVTSVLLFPIRMLAYSVAVLMHNLRSEMKPMSRPKDHAVDGLRLGQHIQRSYAVIFG
jgi:hypothetical protein